MNPQRLFSSLLVVMLVGILFVHSAGAVDIGGIEFPQGTRSFADAVASYNAGLTPPSLPHQNAFNALGTPDYNHDPLCSPGETCTFVSLGHSGSLVLRFTDNALTGSGNTNLDLWIFEVGPDVEDTFVDVSRDGVTWHSVGKVAGGRRGVDLDAFGFGPADRFSYVRLTDDPNEGNKTGATVGADIDAVGAISSVNVSPPLTIQCADVQLCWPSVSNVTYQVEYRSALTTNQWAPLGAPISGNGATNCLIDSVLGQPQRLYRLRTLP